MATRGMVTKGMVAKGTVTKGIVAVASHLCARLKSNVALRPFSEINKRFKLTYY